MSAPEVTHFDPYLEQRSDGWDALKSYYASLAGKIRIDRCGLLVLEEESGRFCCVTQDGSKG